MKVRRRSGKCLADLRKWDLGQDHPVGCASLTELEAVSLAYEYVVDHFRELAGSVPAQGKLPFPGLSSDRTLGEAIAAYLVWRKDPETPAALQWKTDGNEDCQRTMAGSLTKRIGGWKLAALRPPKGAALLHKWVLEERKRLKANTMLKHLTFIGQVLRFAAMAPREWLDAVPELPSPLVKPGEVIYSPDLTNWLGESDLVAIRENLYAGVRNSQVSVDMVARRKLYFAFGYLTGSRKHDLDTLNDSHVSVDVGSFYRRSTKAISAVESKWLAMVPPLKSALLAEQERLGRPFRAGELICGGYWDHAPRVTNAAARRVIGKGARCNLLTLRHSFCRHMALMGVAERDLVEFMGHCDSKMIHAVYGQIPRARLDEAAALWGKGVEASDRPKVLGFIRSVDAEQATALPTIHSQNRPQKEYSSA